MPKPPAVLAALLVACVALVLPISVPRAAQASAPAAVDALTDAPQLAAIYDTILQARFDDARAQLTRACPPAPGPACDALREVAQWWEIQQNQWSRQLDARLEQTAQAAIASAGSWTERDPNSGEAWFYLAGAYAPLSQWRVIRGERLSAARDGKRIKDALERALSLDGRLQDAWFGIGLYHYYADVAPAALKFLRFLLLLPGGDRVQGLQEMLRAREHGELLRGEADYQLHWIYLWYEHQPERALDLLQGLDRKYPTNPLFMERIAEVQHEYFHDHRASAEAWQQLLTRATSTRLPFASMAAARARVGLAAELIELSDAARAIDLATAVVRARASEPYGILARAQLTLGDAYAHAGRRVEAREAYARARDTAPRDDPEGIRDRARDRLAHLPPAP